MYEAVSHRKEKQNREKFIIVTYATVNFMHELHAVIVIIEHEMSTNLHDSDVGHQISDQTLLLGFHHLMERKYKDEDTIGIGLRTDKPG